MLFARIGKYALDLHTCVFTQMRTENTNVKGIHVQSHVESFTVWQDKETKEYEDIKSYVMSLPTLAQINAEREASEPEHNFASEAQEATYVSAAMAQRWYQCDDDDDSAFVPDEIDEDDEVTGGPHSDMSHYDGAVSPLD